MQILIKIMLALLIIILLLSISTYFFMHQPKFGKAPSGKRLERIKNSPNYKDGSFKNLENTPQLAENTSMPEVMFRFLFGKTVNKTPKNAFHFAKTDLKNLDPNANVLFGWGIPVISYKSMVKKYWLTLC